MNDNYIGVAFKVGIVSQSKIGFSKVKFADLDDLETQWLAINFDFTSGDKQAYALKVGSQVNCLMDANLEDGTILGARYSDEDIPPTDNPAVYMREFADGGKVEYNHETGDMMVVSKGNLTANVSGNAVIKAQSVTIDAPQTTCTGALTVTGLLTYQGGMAGSGGKGAAAKIQGTIETTVDVKAGNISLAGHDHEEGVGQPV